MALQRKKKKIIAPIQRGRITIQSTFNNVIISIADQLGNVVSWASAGSSGFKGGRKATPYAAQVTMRNALERARPYTIAAVDIFVSGAGSGRDASIRALQEWIFSIGTEAAFDHCVKSVAPIKSAASDDPVQRFPVVKKLVTNSTSRLMSIFCARKRVASSSGK